MSRRRLLYCLAALATIAAGLAVHLGGRELPHDVRDVVGDALWAMMVLWLFSALSPASRLLTRGFVALGVSFAVELTQLYHTPALDRIRENVIAHLVFGSDFDARDLEAYAGGVVAGVVVEWLLRGSMVDSGLES